MQAELESLVRLDHLPELLQGEEPTIDDEGDLFVCIGDSPSHSLVGSLEIAGWRRWCSRQPNGQRRFRRWALRGWVRKRMPQWQQRTAQLTHPAAPLPAHVQGHFGARFRSYVLYQHHQNCVTQPLIHEEFLNLRVDISTGQIDRLLTESHEQFHEEKDGLLPAARETSS